MEINIDEKRLISDKTSLEMIRIIRENENELHLKESLFFYEFPILKDTDDIVVIAKTLIISKFHGIFAISNLSISDINNKDEILEKAGKELENITSLIFSRLIRNKILRNNSTTLKFSINTFIFAPNLVDHMKEISDSQVISTETKLLEYFDSKIDNNISNELFDEIVSTVEGAKGIMRTKIRKVEGLEDNSKGVLASKIESEISSFDRAQKNGSMAVLDGFQRIRGLAGSGKTIVLAMKAALTHLRDPDAYIVYAFYTKSLYQHIQRLITRFYRQFDDKDPDWNRLRIMHGWGGLNEKGVYSEACLKNNYSPITFATAKVGSNSDPFDFVCSDLLSNIDIKPIYDYMFIDEGQDFPLSFVKLGIKLTKENRVVFAYDDLQTIFRPSTPEIKEIIGTDEKGELAVKQTEDVVLNICYRNPREILVCAHALGFGIYGNMVQTLEKAEHWIDLGYKVIKGNFTPGSDTIIERPIENSLQTISNYQNPNEIVKAFVYDSFIDEISETARMISEDIKQGLRPDDILVIVVDDRNAKNYLQGVSDILRSEYQINSNNIHDSSYGIRDFYKESEVTLSTVHKAKGNEAFMVYVLGVDALFAGISNVRERNVLFTAMTRAKGWVRVSGISEAANKCKREIELALSNFPNLCFKYPSPEQLHIIKRDLTELASKKQRVTRKIDEIMNEFSEDEIISIIQQRKNKKDL